MAPGPHKEVAFWRSLGFGPYRSLSLLKPLKATVVGRHFLVKALVVVAVPGSPTTEAKGLFTQIYKSWAQYVKKERKNGCRGRSSI